MATTKTSANAETITNQQIHDIADRLAQGKAIRRRLPDGGRIHIDRSLPFLVAYRKPPNTSDLGTDRLVTSEASYLVASALPYHHRQLGKLVTTVAAAMTEQFGAFLLLEVWAGPNIEVSDVSDSETPPGFRVWMPPGPSNTPLADSFEAALGRVRQLGVRADVSVRRRRRCWPAGAKPLLANGHNVTVVGLEVRPIYHDRTGTHLYPVRLRTLRRVLSRAIQQSVFDFTRTQTTHRPDHYRMLGNRAIKRAVFKVDHTLSSVGAAFDILLQSTPVNTIEAQAEFKRRRHQVVPVFRYRPLPADPVVLKRQLYSAPIDQVDDTALYLLLRQKQDELDRQITMMNDRNTKRFLHGSLQVYGEVDDELFAQARAVLRKFPRRSRTASRDAVDARGFARVARQELRWYQKRMPDNPPRLQIRDDIGSGLMVSNGVLLIGSNLRVSARRVDALIQHEVGTHVLTHANGRTQKLQQLAVGLAGYEALQEGLAVFSEFLVGGLDRGRMRLLAARVVAARLLTDGADFVECYRALTSDYDFSGSEAFGITTRIFRGGGLTKDSIYLQGFDRLIKYLHTGQSIEPLFIGKIATRHLPIVEELLWRHVLHEPPVLPRYLERPDVQRRLARARQYSNVVELVNKEFK